MMNPAQDGINGGADQADQPVVVLVEILGRHERVHHRERLRLDARRPRFTIGRGMLADVVLDDPHAAALHAAVDIGPAGEIMVSDLQSVNGIVMGGLRLHGLSNHAAERGEFTVGRTAIRVRTGAERLAPEKPESGEDHRAERGTRRLMLLGGSAYALYFAHTAWVGAPQDLTGAVATALIAAFLGAGVWIAFWTVLSRLLLGDWRWERHAAIFFGVFTALTVLEFAADLSWFALSLPHFPLRETMIAMLAAGGALYWHISNAARVTARRALWTAVTVPLILGGVSYFLVARGQARDVNHIAAEAQLYPPGARLRAGKSLDEYFEHAERLKDEADSRRRAMPNEGGEEI